MIESLKSNPESSESEVFIFSDGPRDASASIRVDEVRKFIRGLSGFLKVTVIEKTVNEGLAQSIISGVSQIVREYGKVIVLEDDLIVSPFFLNYMNSALNKYESAQQVMHVAGYMYPVNNSSLPETFFLEQTTCWGWATWKRAWDKFDKNPAHLDSCFTPQMIYDFNLKGSCNFWKQVELNLQGRMDTWAIFWYASVYLNKGLALHPKFSYVENIGHDGTGTNCDSSSDFKVSFASKAQLLSSEIELSMSAKRELIIYFNSIKISFARRVINKLKRIKKNHL